MGVFIRQALMSDIQQMQNCNLQCLPENYALRYYLFHFVTWPQLLFVAEDEADNGRIVGYVLAKMEEEDKDKNASKFSNQRANNRRNGTNELSEFEQRRKRRDSKLKKKGKGRIIINNGNNNQKEEEGKEEEKKKEEESTKWKHGHITSLAVLRTHRKLGLATKLMIASEKQMMDVYDADYVSLHVRETNHAAYHLYSVSLKFQRYDTEKGYYADGEDAHDMRKPLKSAYSAHVEKHMKNKVNK